MEQQSLQDDKEEVQVVEVSRVNLTNMEEQSPQDDKEEVQVLEEVSSERNCGLQQLSVLDDKKEENATVEDKNETTEVPKDNGFLIDVIGEPFEDDIIDPTARREPVSACIDSESDSESDASSSSVSSLSSFSSLEDLKDTEKDTKTTRQPKSIKTKGELGIEDLPPVEELTISVPEDDMQKIGKVYSIVDQLVVVESHKNSPPLDLDSVLFLDHGKPLGHVFDVFGPVKQPYYLVRFNSNEDIIKRGIAKEDSVFYAPSHAEVTNFIFTDELMRQKGSDASWEHNNEPPEEHIDFSDDEKEMAARKKRAAKNRKPSTQEDDDVVHKRPNTSFEAKAGRDAVTPDVSVVFSSKNSNYFRHTPVQRIMQNGEVNTSPGIRKSFSSSWLTSSHPKSPQRMPLQQTSYQQNPGPLSPAVCPANPNFVSSNAPNRNVRVTPPCRTPVEFSVPTPSALGMPHQQVTPHQAPVPLAPATPPVNPSSFTFSQPNQNVASSCRSPGSFSVPSQFHLGPLRGMSSQQESARGILVQHGLPQGMPPQQGLPQGIPMEQGPPQGMLMQQGLPQGMPMQQGPPQGMLMQQGPPQGMPMQQEPPQGMPMQQGPPQGMPMQQGPSQGMPMQQGLPQGMPMQHGPPQGMPMQQGPPQGMPMQQGPPQGMPMQQGPPQGMPMQQGPPQGMTMQQGPPQGMTMQQGPPQGMTMQQGPPQGMTMQQGPPQGMTMQQGPPASMPSQQIFQQSPVPLSSCAFPVNSTDLSSVHGTNQNVASSHRSVSSQQVLHQPGLSSPSPALTPNRSCNFLPGISSGSPFSNSRTSPFLGTATAPPPQWPATSPVLPQSSYQQYLCNWNSYAPTNNVLQSFDKHSTQTSSHRFQTKVPERFSFTEKVQPRFGAPAVLPPSGLYHPQSTSVPPPTSIWNAGKT